ncbi:MAG: CDGSH iron-sulfur domain-containing protein, partial [Candidatus Pacebacteria bacterium]|nr:CDGSH iron-sulfur domain-containing protein [Candidatus Paceibacterota bacterium]
MEKNIKKIIVSKDGPYIVSGDIPLIKEVCDVDNEGEPGTYEKTEDYPRKDGYSLCRCGRSFNKPYCDGTHHKVGFDGTETASREGYLDQSEKLSGPEIDLTDAPRLCSGGRFCHKGTWEHTENSDDPESKKIAIESACNCPSGRLVAWDKKTGEPIEETYDPTISILEYK